MNNKYIDAKEIEKKHRISYQTINRYTSVGLLKIAFKKSNIRFYKREQVDKSIKKIFALTSEGYPLVLIRKKLVGI
jgi:DNA-binding transcriptional MerR regulator